MKKPRVIVLTGGSTGVGRAAAQAFARTEGAYGGLIARGKGSFEGAKLEIEQLGGKAVVVSCDVADADAVDAAATTFENELGPLDVWVNNAMTSVFAFIKETTPQEFKRVTEVCYLGYVNGTLAALKHAERQTAPRHTIWRSTPWLILGTILRIEDDRPFSISWHGPKGIEPMESRPLPIGLQFADLSPQDFNSGEISFTIKTRSGEKTRSAITL